MITFQYFEGCPNAQSTLMHLRQVMNELNIPENVLRMQEVPGPAEAEKSKFQGSPTILINGVDIYSMKIPKSFSYSCRFYSFNGTRTGIIPKPFIKEKIAELYSVQ